MTATFRSCYCSESFVGGDGQLTARNAIPAWIAFLVVWLALFKVEFGQIEFTVASLKSKTFKAHSQMSPFSISVCMTTSHKGESFSRKDGGEFRKSIEYNKQNKHYKWEHLLCIWTSSVFVTECWCMSTFTYAGLISRQSYHSLLIRGIMWNSQWKCSRKSDTVSMHVRVFIFHKRSLWGPSILSSRDDRREECTRERGYEESSW